MNRESSFRVLPPRFYRLLLGVHNKGSSTYPYYATDVCIVNTTIYPSRLSHLQVRRDRISGKSEGSTMQCNELCILSVYFLLTHMGPYNIVTLLNKSLEMTRHGSSALTSHHCTV